MKLIFLATNFTKASLRKGLEDDSCLPTTCFLQYFLHKEVITNKKKWTQHSIYQPTIFSKNTQFQESYVGYIDAMSRKAIIWLVDAMSRNQQIFYQNFNDGNDVTWVFAELRHR